jgi:hypothetical protein
MPAAFDLEQKGTHYVTCANSIQLDNVPKKNGQFDNDFAMGPYMAGIHNYRCCPHNYGMGWPYYAEEMWLATPDRGLCASLYGACEVKAKAGDGTLVRIVEETDYPFGDAIQFRIDAPNEVTFPLYLRIPRWCGKPNAALNGKKLDVAAGPASFVIIERTWKSGDSVQLQLPMKTGVRTWEKNHDSVSIDHGPLTFSLAIQENWKKSGTDQWPEYEVFPASSWNYGLVLDHKHPERSLTLQKKSGTLPANPFTPTDVPVSLRAKARKIKAWQADSENVVGLLQQSPAKSSEPVETVTLIPMGAARLRISAFPTVGTGSHANEWVLPQAPGDRPKQS